MPLFSILFFQAQDAATMETTDSSIYIRLKRMYKYIIFILFNKQLDSSCPVGK